MKSIFLIFACAAPLAMSGCAAANRQSHFDSGGNLIPLSEGQAPSRLETVAYDWESTHVRVTFCRETPGSPWVMTVRDTWDIYDQFKEEGNVWKLSEGKCSKQQCLRIIDRSLAKFHAERPDARLETVAVEMHVVRELWREILAGLSRRLSTVAGEKRRSRADIPSAVNEEIQHVLEKSTTTAEIKTQLKKHGMNVGTVRMADELAFKDSLAGKKWSDIATLPGAGVLLPGVFEFEVGESRIGVAPHSEPRPLTVSKTAQR